MPRSLAALAGFLLLTPAGVARAQTPLIADVEHDTTRLLPVLRALEREPRIRVTALRNLVEPDSPQATQRARVELYTPRFADESLYFVQFRPPSWASAAHESFPRPLPLSQVFQIEVRRDARWAGAVTGAVALGGSLLIMGLHDLCPKTPECDEASEVALSTLGGAAVGALVGGVAGYVLRRWKTAYRVGPVPPGSGNPLWR